jgi:hypothetical protein
MDIRIQENCRESLTGYWHGWVIFPTPCICFTRWFTGSKGDWISHFRCPALALGTDSCRCIVCSGSFGRKKSRQKRNYTSWRPINPKKPNENFFINRAVLRMFQIKSVCVRLPLYSPKIGPTLWSQPQ